VAVTLEMQKRRRKRAGGLLVLFLITILSLAIDTRRVSAHAFLSRSDPADGSVLASAPKQMRLWFTEPLEIELTTITLQDGKNHTWQLKPAADPNDPSVVVVDLPELPPNAYRVNWRTVSDEDLHIISGSVVFGIQQAVGRGGILPKQNATPFAEVTLHWINLLSFAAVIGALINMVFLFPSVKRRIQNEQSLGVVPSLQGKTLRLALWCSVIALIAGLFAAGSKSLSLQSGAGLVRNVDWNLITSTVYMRRELASEACLIAISLLILYWIKQEKGVAREAAQPAGAKLRNALLFSFVALWILLQSLNSHALAFNSFSPARVLAYGFHLLGAGMWIGGQIALIFFIAPRLRTRSEDYALAREIYSQFGGIAAVGVAVLLVSGLYNGAQQVASVDALLLTPYGRALLFKTLLVVLTGLIGLRHASHFHFRVARILHEFISQRAGIIIFGKVNPAATLRLQLLGGVAIFLLAAFMGSTQPARGPAFDAPAQAVTAQNAPPISLSNMADDLLVNFSVKPNQPGQNFIDVGVFNTRRPVPGPIEEVVVKLLPPGGQGEIQVSVPLSDSEKDGSYHVSTDAMQVSGDWKVSVIVRRAGLQDAVLEAPWRVISSAPTITNRQTLISSHSLAPLLTMASLLLAILLGGAWLALALRPKLLDWSK
jgi:copper transport protein